MDSLPLIHMSQKVLNQSTSASTAPLHPPTRPSSIHDLSPLPHMAESDAAARKMADGEVSDAAAGKTASGEVSDAAAGKTGNGEVSYDPAAGKMGNREVSDDGRAVEVSSGEDTLPGVLRSFVDGVWPTGDGGDPLLQRLRAATCETAPRLRDASRNSARDLLAWTKQGSGLRAILVISVGTITMISLTGLLIFMSFLLVATANAIIVSVLMSLAAAGGFLALFFACLVAVYVGAVSVAIFVISATVISAIVGVMIATGWLGFFWMIWFAARKSLDLTKHSIGMTTSAVQSYSASRHARQKSTD